MKFPEIQPASPVSSGADALDRAGAEFGQAAKEAAGLFHEMRKDELTLQSQAAAVEVATAAHDVKQAVESRPYVPTETAKAWFGGTLPDDVQATRNIVVNGEAKTVEEPVIPMHKIAERLYTQRMADAVESAAGRITAPGWAEKFKAHAAGTVEAKRGEILDWQRGQALADQQIRTIGEYQAAIRAEAWGLAEVIARSGKAGIVESQKMIEEVPRAKATAEILKRLDSFDPREIQKVQQEVRSGAYSKIFDGPEEAKFLAAADHQLRNIEAAREKAQKDREARAAATAAGMYGQALAASSTPGHALYGKPVWQILPVATLFKIPNLTSEDFNKFTNLIREGGKPLENDQVWIQVLDARRTGEFRAWSRDQVQALRPFVTQEHWDFISKEWSDAQTGTPPTVDEHSIGRIRHRLEKVFGYDPKSAEFDTIVGEVEIALAPAAREAKKQGLRLAPKQIDEVLAQVAPRGKSGYRGGLSGALRGAIPEVARSAIYNSVTAEGLDVPRPEVIERHWRAAQAKEGDLVKVWRQVKPGTEWTDDSMALIWAQEVNAQNRQMADQWVALREAAAPPDKPAFPESWTPEMKRWAIFMEGGITATDRAEKAKADAAAQQAAQRKQLEDAAAAKAATDAEKAAREAAARQEINVNVGRAEIEAAKQREMEEWKRRTRDAQQKAGVR